MPMNPRLLRPLASRGGFDADAQAYIAAVEAADTEPLEQGVRDAINDFVVGCKADGIWGAIKASCILAGARTLAGALVPLKGTAPTNNNFVSGDYDRETGLVGNGSNKYLDTNRNANADPQDDFHCSFYLSVIIASSDVSFGAGAAFGGATQILGSAFRCRNGTGDTPTVSMGTVSLHAMSRSNAADYVGRSGGTSQTFTRASQTPYNGTLVTHARRSTTVGLFSAMRINFYSIGENLDLALLDNRVTALVAAIGNAI